MKHKMWILFMLLIIAIAAFGASEEPPSRLPVSITCYLQNNEVQEVRACRALEKAMRAYSKVRESQPGESFLAYHVSLNYDEKSGVVGAMYESVWVHPVFHGIGLMVWSRVEVLHPHDIMDKQRNQELLLDSLRVYDKWLNLAIPIFQNLCPPCEQPRRPRSVSNESR